MDITNIENHLKTYVNQIEEKILHRVLTKSFDSKLVPTIPLSYEAGLNPIVLTTTHDLPTSYPFSEADIALSNGTGSGACNPSTTTIHHGTKERTFTPTIVAFDTDPFCITDMQYKFKGDQQMRNIERGLMNYVDSYTKDWFRVQNIRMIDTKVSTTGTNSLDFDSNTDADFTGVSLPTQTLNWTHLNDLYILAAQSGMGDFAIGMAQGGNPVFSLRVGPSVHTNLFLSNLLVRETVNYASPQDNFAPFGISQAVGGFLPSIDITPIRYAADGTTAIYPTRNVAKTTGTGWEVNPNYAPISKGGLAKYETFTIMCKNIYSRRPRLSNPTKFAMSEFGTINYAGEFDFINNKTFGGTNDTGKFGYYRAEIAHAAYPEYPELGFTGITLIPGETA